jgi:hypothetical protein
MNKQLKTFAEEAGCFETMHGPKELIGGEKELILFAELVRQDERKSCAKILDAFAKDMENKEWTMGAAAMRGAADTIRFKQSSDEAEGEK